MSRGDALTLDGCDHMALKIGLVPTILRYNREGIIIYSTAYLDLLGNFRLFGRWDLVAESSLSLFNIYRFDNDGPDTGNGFCSVWILTSEVSTFHLPSIFRLCNRSKQSNSRHMHIAHTNTITAQFNVGGIKCWSGLNVLSRNQIKIKLLFDPISTCIETAFIK